MLGLTGLFLNLEGREAQGIVAPGAEAAALKAEIVAKLHGLRDEEKKAVGINEAFDTAALYAGPYLENAPDLIIGYNAGYRISWDCATGVVAGAVFEDNLKPWSGDHCVDPRLVPGVFFCNRKMDDGRAGAHRHRADGAAPVRHRAAALHGRQAAGGAGVTVSPLAAVRAIALGALAAAVDPAGRRGGVRQSLAGRAQGDRPRVRRAGPRADRADDRQRPAARLRAAGAAAAASRRWAPPIPPQSPVAWSTFITGLDPGGHGIFDFVHRDPKTMLPYLSTTRTEGVDANAGPRASGSCRCRAATVELLRRGQPFWELLEDRGVPTTIIRMPANFPPSGTATRELSGMGTPDLLGTYGTFSFYTSEPYAFAGQTLSGGIVHNVRVRDGRVRANLEGPDNPFLRTPEKVKAEFTAYPDRANQFAKIVVGAEERLLKVGEWSDWVPVSFDAGADADAARRSAVLPEGSRSVLRALREPGEHRSAGSGDAGVHAARIRGGTGRGYRPLLHPGHARGHQGAQDRRAHRRRVPRRRPRIAGDENLRQYRYVLDRFEGGFLFYYFGNVDQVAHMMWRARDPRASGLRRGQGRAERRGGRGALPRPRRGRQRRRWTRLGPDDLLVVMSDHGFTSWRRAFHLNSWLRDNGYIVLKNPALKEDPGLLRQRRLVAHARVRAGAERPLRQPEGPREGRHRRAGRARGAGEGARRRSCSRSSIRRRACRPITKVYRREQVYYDGRRRGHRAGPGRRLRQGHARLGRVGARRHAART